MKFEQIFRKKILDYPCHLHWYTFGQHLPLLLYDGLCKKLKNLVLLIIFEKKNKFHRIPRNPRNPKKS